MIQFGKSFNSYCCGCWKKAAFYAISEIISLYQFAEGIHALGTIH